MLSEKKIKFEFSDALVEDSITQEVSDNGALVIESKNRVYFISRDFIEWAYKIIHERENKDKA